MIRRLLLLFVCALASIGVWADPSISKEYDLWANVIKVTTTEAGSITSSWIESTLLPACESGRVILTVDGPINQADINAIADIDSGPIVVIDYGKTNLSGLTVKVPAQAIGLRLPISEDLTASYTLVDGSPSNLQYVMSSGMNGIRYHAGDDEKGSDHINLHITVQAGVSAFVSHYGGNPSWIQYRNINLSTTVDNLDYSELSSKVSSGFSITYPADNTGEEYVMPISECTECYITKDSDNKVATVHTVHPGHFKALFKQDFNYANDYIGWTFKFDSACNLSEADLLTLVGDKDYQSNMYYVDLFDVPATEEFCYWDDPDHPEKVGLITKVIKEIRERNSTITDQSNNYGFKGLILPKDHTIYGSGTTLIQGINKGAAGDIATCKEFIVYHKTLEEDGTTPVDDILTVAHIYQYQSNGAVTTYQAAYDKMMSLLNAHTAIAQTEIYQISTNFQLQSSNGSYTKIDITDLPSDKSIVETYNNEMVGAATRALMISHPAEAGDFATSATATGMMRTTTEKLTIVGPMSESDYAAIGTFATGNGPRILDLRGVTTEITETLLKKIGNSEIEYLVLPETADKDLIFANYNGEGNMTGLKAVINAAPAQDSQPTIVANIYEAGSLYEARIHALDLAIGADGIYHLYGACGVQSVTLKGSLNAADIAAQVSNKAVTEGGALQPIYMGADGHWAGEASATPANFGLGYEQGTLTSFDLEEAVFETKTDMNFWKAGYEKLTSVKLPTATEMNLIPANCFNNISTLTYLCVPYNYEYIEDGAFWLSGIDHMTTTDDFGGAEVDNGPKTWTISANMKELGTRPTNAKEFVSTVFPMNVGVQEIYCLAIKVPKCYANVFALNTSYGWGGDDSEQPYCRDRYFNGGDPDKAWAVLRFPSEASYNTSAGTKESSYEVMKRLYTDVNKEFTKMEQTGAVDANGDPIIWPTQYEAYRSYNQASFGYTWNDWAVTRDYTIDGHVNGGGSVNQGTAAGQVYVNAEAEADGGTGTGEGDYDFDDYIGWHQIVLSQATYVEPKEIIENEKIVREYVEDGWYTFCIPFDMTVSQVQQMLGVPASAGNVICKLDGVEVTEAIMPDIRQLTSVTRKKGEGSAKNVVTLRLTDNLWNGTKAQYLDFDLSSGAGNGKDLVDAATNNKTDRCLVGGRPYIIKAYRRAGNEYKIYGQNLGLAILMRHSDAFGVEASCVTNGLYEQLGGEGNTSVTLQFAIPYENHKVQAMKDGESATYLEYDVDGTAYRYNYTMVGQFWQQPLPLYCFYMSKGKWYRYTGKKPYTWDPFKCIIMATKEIADGHPNGGGYRDNDRSNYPNIVDGTDDLLDGNFYLGFLDGRDDDDFDQMANADRYVFTFDDGITEYDENGFEVTAIESVDGDGMTATPVNGKVYNMSGQLVGTSLERLGKGMYIVNGKKYVVK